HFKTGGLQLPEFSSYTATWGTLGTIRPHLNFDAAKDAQTFFEAISGEGKPAAPSLSSHLQSVQSPCRGLLKTLEAVFPGQLQIIIRGLLRPAAQYDALEIQAGLAEMDSVVLFCSLAWERLKESVKRTPSISVWGKEASSSPALHSFPAFSMIFSMTFICHLLSFQSHAGPLTIFQRRFVISSQEAGRDPRMAVRIMVSRSEMDLLSIRTEFKRHYGISLYSFIQVKPQAALLGLCKAEDL
uniref:Annexin A9 n=1 Tax=Laticauda laticaudata TaxID=8630 RepID=A0A8C5RCK9_LATLA